MMVCPYCHNPLSSDEADSLRNENAKLRELVDELYPLADYGAMDASELDTAHDLMSELRVGETSARSRYAELFGTPERAARTLHDYCFNTVSCAECGIGCKGKSFQDHDNILEWLRGDA